MLKTAKRWGARRGRTYLIRDKKMKKIEYKKALSKLRNVTKVQCQNGNWDYDEYMRGMANGLILAKAIFENKQPVYFDAPDKCIDEPEHAEKQPHYKNEDGTDLINDWAERYTPDEFRTVMIAQMEKYQRRYGKKDLMVEEAGKIADYANRLLQYEQNRLVDPND